MDERESFLRAIIAAPDDDIPRMHFSDWLDEHGRTVECGQCKAGEVYGMRVCRDGIARNAWGPCPRCNGSGYVPDADKAQAEFVRVQCSPCTCTYSSHNRASTCGRCRRERELHAGNWDKWNVGPGGLLLGGVRLDQWSRGFIETLDTPWPDWLAHHVAIREATPLRRVRLTTWPEIDTTDDGVHIQGVGHVVPWFDDGENHAHREYILKGLHAEFHGIEFELPHATTSRASGYREFDFARLFSAT